MAGEERRQYPRFEAAIRMTFLDADALRDEESKNLSRGGCALTSRQKREVGSRIPITLVHPANRAEMTLIGEVVRAAALPDGRWSMGVRFIDFDEAFQKRLHQFVDSVTAPATTSPPSPRAPSVLAAIDSLAKVTDLVADTRLQVTSGEKLEGLPAPALRLAALVDGKRTVADVVGLSQMPPDQAASAVMYLLRHGVVKARVSAGVAAAGPDPGAAAAAETAAKPAIAWRRWAPIAGAAALVLVGAYGLRAALHARGSRPEQLDPSVYSDVVPMTELTVVDGKAFGVVGSSWSARPEEDREKRVETLGDRLEAHGVTALVLMGPDSQVVDRWQRDAN